MRRHGGWKILVGFAVLVLLLALVWNWDWFLPVVDADASASLGHKVSIQHLRVSLGRIIRIQALGIVAQNPEVFPANVAEFARIDRLLVDVDVLASIEHGTLSLATIEIDHPVLNIRQLADGSSNYKLPGGKSAGPAPLLGELVINDGHASIIMPVQKSNFTLALQTRPVPPGDKLFTGGEILVDAKGTYANAPITGRFIGGALLSLRDPSLPYPVDLHLANGATQVSLVGRVDDPLHFAGAHLHLVFSGQDMADLYQLTDVPIPATPPFALAGELEYVGGAFRFTDFKGRVGSSDLEGTIIEAPGSPRRMVTADLVSQHVDLTDLTGFLGGTPGNSATPEQNAATRAKIAAAAASPNLLPDKQIDLPKLNETNVDLHYRGAHIINRDVPFDNVVAHLVIQNGHISVDPLNFAVGTGSIASHFDLNPQDGVLHTTAGIDFRQLPLARLMAATHAFAGDGTVGGGVTLTGTGNSVAAIMGHGNGHAALYLQHGADVSALLVDLAGLQVGDAILSALGVPQKTKIQCLVSDFDLTDGMMNTKTFLLATSEANILGTGTVNLQTEKLDLALRTEATHFSIGSLSTPINITGPMKHPSVLPAAGPLALRAGPAVALGVLFPPLAILPTIRLGLGDKNACADTIEALNAGHPHNPN